MNKPIINIRTWINIGLFVFLILVFYLAYQKNNNDQGITRLSSLTLSEINEIRIPRDDNHSIIFKKNNNIWYMTRPYQLKAHQFRINTLLSLTQQPVQKSYPVESLNLKDYALDKPRASIFFNNTKVSFGSTNPVNKLRYLLTENKLILSADKIYPLVSAQASSFIDLSLLPDDFNINKIITPNTEVFYSNGQWISTGETPLSADQIQTLLQHWRSAKAFAIHRYLARKKLGKIQVFSETKSLVFEISDDDPWLILALPELKIEYHLDKSQKNLLFGIIDKDNNDA